ncbi:MAG: GNAT family N-acetyltransferase [Pseudomonadota bacterium]
MSNFTIQPTSADDVAGLKTVLDLTDLFPSEMLLDLLRPALEGETDALWLTYLRHQEAVGLCYVVPEEMAQGTWNIRALAVRPDLQGRGIGTALVRAVEQRLKDKQQRILIVDTSGADGFARARDFYARNGFEKEARIRDFWAFGDDKVTFWKALAQ